MTVTKWGYSTMQFLINARIPKPSSRTMHLPCICRAAGGIQVEKSRCWSNASRRLKHSGVANADASPRWKPLMKSGQLLQGHAHQQAYSRACTHSRRNQTSHIHPCIHSHAFERYLHGSGNRQLLTGWCYTCFSARPDEPCAVTPSGLLCILRPKEVKRGSRSVVRWRSEVPDGMWKRHRDRIWCLDGGSCYFL